jgi:rod shape-determining protein MreD
MPMLITLAGAMVLTMLPLPAVLEPLRPYWVALVLLYWCLETQDLVRWAWPFSSVSRSTC